MSSNPFNNIIFVTLDGYRKDKLGICPFLQSYVSYSIFFTNMITVSPYTLAAHHAIFSGMYPSRNGVNAYYNMFRFASTSPLYNKISIYMKVFASST